jgi:hypothetical protein
MTTEDSRRRRRTTVSLSSPDASSEPVDQLSRTVEIIHRVTRSLPTTVIDREELIALGGFLTQISGALLTLTDLLGASAHHFDRTQLRCAHPDTTPAERRPTAASLLRDCRTGYLAAYTSAQALHADFRRCPADLGAGRKRQGEQ